MKSVGDLSRDLYRDLRDRRLLPVVIGLAVAIVAVPFLIKGGGSDQVDPVEPVSASAPPLEGLEELDPVVVTDVPGLRNYRERLDRFNSRNPFKQQLTGANTAAGGAGNLEEVDAGTSTTSGSTSTDASSSTSVSTGTDTSTSTGITEPADSTPPDGGNAGSGKDPEPKVFEITIDVRVGRPGNTKVLKGVESLAFLPGDERPVVQYVEGNSERTAAAFVVSRDVDSTSGDGKCDPGRNNCQFLLMKPGDLRLFEYGTKETTTTYRLELLAIHRQRVEPDA